MKRIDFFVSFFLSFTFVPAFAGTMTIGTPGGPAPALKECVAEFQKANDKAKIEVVSGPVEKWQKDAVHFDLLFSGSENMMDDFLKRFDFLDTSSLETHFLRPAALLVRKGNPLKIKGIQDLISKDFRILVVNGAGQVGMWEDIVGRTRSVDALSKFRKNIKFAANNTGEAEKKWNEDKNLDVWVVFNIWGNRSTNDSEIVKIEDEFVVFRSSGSIKNTKSKDSKLREDFLTFLKSNNCRDIFKKHGWQ